MRRREFVGAALAAGPVAGGVSWPQRFGDGRDWFSEKRFGLFVHWRLYAIPAWHEQHMYRMGWTRKDLP